MRTKYEHMGELSNRSISDPDVPQANKTGADKSLFQIVPKWLDRHIDENVKRAQLRTHWLAVKWCNEQSYSFRKSHKRPCCVCGDPYRQQQEKPTNCGIKAADVLDKLLAGKL